MKIHGEKNDPSLPAYVKYARSSSSLIPKSHYKATALQGQSYKHENDRKLTFKSLHANNCPEPEVGIYILSQEHGYNSAP